VLDVSATELEEAYRRCDEIARSSNFYNGFRLLPPNKHRALSAVYAFLRQCDDVSDDPGTLEQKEAAFSEWRRLLNEGMENRISGHPTLPALIDTIRDFKIPVEYFHLLMVGTESDLRVSSYPTFSDLQTYCYHVASVVGLICIHIFGFEDPGAKKSAEACGIAFQLTNILRDIKEDLARNRIYIPLEDLERFQYTEDDLRHEVEDNRFRSLMAFEAERARSFYEQARPLIKMLSKDSRSCFRAMYESYATILSRIQQKNYQVFGERIRLGPAEKFQILLKALIT